MPVLVFVRPDPAFAGIETHVILATGHGGDANDESADQDETHKRSDQLLRQGHRSRLVQN